MQEGKTRYSTNSAIILHWSQNTILRRMENILNNDQVSPIDTR